MYNPSTQESPIPKWFRCISIYLRYLAMLYLVFFHGFQLQANPEDWPVYEATPEIELSKSMTVAPISCYGSVQISVSQSGFANVTPQILISEKLLTYGQFKVIVLETGRNFVDCSDIGKSRSAKVTDTITNNSCWVVLKVEDKLMPGLICTNDTISCTNDPFSVVYEGLISVTDNCDNHPTIKYGLSYQKLNCDINFSSIMHVSYIVTDKSGNTNTCNKDVYFKKVPLDSIVFPENDTVYCPNPFVSAEPSYKGQSVNPLCDLLASYSDDTIPVCGGMYKISRLWVVMDWCLRASRMQRQEILVADTTRPQITCPPNITLKSSGQSCGVSYTLPATTATDACSASSAILFFVRIDGSFNSRPGLSVTLDVGNHNLEYIAIDPCGNSDTCTTFVDVVDESAPTIVCPPKLVASLGANGEVTINVEYLNHFLYYTDNCGIDTVLIRRMRTNCNIPLDTTFRDHVSFCCNDIGMIEMIVLKVVDESGNANFCMIEVEIQNKNLYTVNCPLNKTIKCNVDRNNLNLTGKPIVANICTNFTSSITFKDSGTVDSCQFGIIYRKFYITFFNGFVDSSCSQILTIVNSFGPVTIVWARDTTIVACKPNHPDSIKSRPIALNDSCNVVKFAFRDSMLVVPPDSCMKILRLWNTVARCGIGILRDTQEIKLTDFFAPLLKGPKDSFHCVDDTFCFPFIRLNLLQVSGCNTNLNIVNSYNNNGADASDIYPLGRHEVVFTVTDACNHIVRDTLIVEVVDKIAPIIGCRLINRNIEANDSAKVIARDLLLQTYKDNCTPSPLLKISFDPSNPNDTCRYIACSMHKPFPDSLWPLTVYVKDLSGNTALCTGRVNVDDPSGFCNNLVGGKISVNGLIRTINKSPMPNVKVNEMMTKEVSITNELGNFEIKNLSNSASVEIAPYDNDNWLENLSTLDIIRIQKHILGVDMFSHPHEWIAADLNKDGRVTTNDISILRKLLLGTINEVKSNTSWRFIQEGFAFNDLESPLNEEFPEHIKSSKELETLQANFISIKVGDVSGAAGIQNQSPLQRIRYYSISTTDISLPVGYKSISNFNVEQDITIEGYQMRVKFDPDLAVPDRIIEYSKTGEGSDMSEDQFVIKDDELIISFINDFPRRLNKGDKLFSIVWNNLKKCKLSSVLRETAYNGNEVYTSGYSSYPLVVHINNQENDLQSPDIEDFRLAPNPFKDNCQISFISNLEVDSYLEIISGDAKVVMSKWIPLNKGSNKILVSSNQLAGQGIYYYKFIVGDYLKKGKIVMAK
ncbi:MAG: HYR domain-containing protein [Saprospiraceae bacterium]